MLFSLFNLMCIVHVLSKSHLNKRSSDNITSYCKEVDANDVRYLLYTRQAPQGTIIDPAQPKLPVREVQTIMIIHGWLSNHNFYKLPKMRETYLRRYDTNIVAVDWSTDAFDSRYELAACKALKVGQIVGKFICRSNIPIENLHIVAHSMGSHVAGSAGATTQMHCGRKIDRITSLDPGGHNFQDAPVDQRLDSEDASFVDVLHTAEQVWSYYGNIGTLDFHVNCGIRQPACPKFPEFLNTNCSHLIVIDYMIESINSDNFIAESCAMCPYQCRVDKDPEHNIMGEDVLKNTSPKIFYVPTRNFPPYALGNSRS